MAAAEPLPKTDMVLVLDEDFTTELNRFDGKKGVWSTLPRQNVLMTNAAETVFWDRGVLDPDVEAGLPPTLATGPRGLAIRTHALPKDARDAVDRYLTATAQGRHAGKIKYATGLINTHQTWSQAYGYFEITAKIPKGKGRWPAFWMTSAGRGWPPEIDVFEAYGKGLRKPTKKDNVFHTAVHFDATNGAGETVFDTDITNPYAPDASGGASKPAHRRAGDRDLFAFRRILNAERDLGADIYDRFNTYAVHWTPREIIYYFGPTPQELREIFRAPTPPDAQTPMYVIANDQFTARGGYWQPDLRMLDQVLDPENAFWITNIKIYALRPDVVIALDDTASAWDPRSSVVQDTEGDDDIAPGPGFDIVTLSQGRDTVRLERDIYNTVIYGFGPDDRLVLDGYPFLDGTDIKSRLTQVGGDVWLPSGADPVNSSTVIFKSTQIADFSAAQFSSRWPVALDVWIGDNRKPNAPLRATPEAPHIAAQPGGSKITDDGHSVAITGGPDGDMYILSNPGTTIDETPSGGVDTLVVFGTQTLPANVEMGIARAQGGRLIGSPGNDRLQAAAQNVVLDGQGGSDFFDVAPGASATIILGSGPGHSKLRGFDTGSALRLPAAVRSNRAGWTFEAQDGGTTIRFGPDHSLTLTDVDPDTAKQIMGDG